MAQQSIAEVSGTKDVVLTIDDKPAADSASESQHFDPSSPNFDREAFLASFSPEEEKKILRKVDFRLLILAGLTYMIKQLDVNNASAIKVLSPGKPTNIMVQLGMTSNQYNWVQSIYYISYVLFEVPSNLLLKTMGPRLFQARIVFIWGSIVALQAACQKGQTLLVARFFLGVADAGMFPGFMTQFQSWYRSDEFMRTNLYFNGITALANVVSSILIYGISFLDGHRGISSWQWVFIIEGVLTVAYAFVLYFLLPEYPTSKSSARWFTPREQAFLEQRLPPTAPRRTDSRFSVTEAIRTLRDPRLWSFMVTQMLMNTGNYGLSWFLPTIITNLGFVSPPRNILLLIPPAAATISGIFITSYIISRAWLPRPLLAISISVVEVGIFTIFLTTNRKAAIYAAVVLGSALASTFFVPFWAWRSSSMKGATGTALSYGFQNCIGQLGGIIGPQLFVSKYKYNGYKVSYGVCTACVAAGVFAALTAWYFTRNIEREIMRVRREKLKAARDGQAFTGKDYVDDQD